MLTNAKTAVIGFAAFSGTGKTTLLLKLLPLLRAQGLRIGVVKHAHHDFDVDHVGKDSYALRKSGADQMLIGSRQRWALIVEEPSHEPGLNDLLGQLQQDTLDLVLVEGYKWEHFPKIELHRPSLGFSLLFPKDENIVAVATDGPLEIETSLPLLNLNDPDEISSFIVRYVLDGTRLARSQKLS
jgi:molybdopterin-guanine dinucleotide biosynthesis protein MobB